MKNIKYILSSVVLLSILFTIGCSGNDDDAGGLSAQQLLLNKFHNSWLVTSVTYDNGTDYNDDFSSFVMNITSDAYSTTNSPDFGPFSKGSSSGSWQLVGEPSDSPFQIERSSDGLIIDVQVSDTNMTLIFNFTDNDGDGVHEGRYEAVTGDWVFQFTK